MGGPCGPAPNILSAFAEILPEVGAMSVTRRWTGAFGASVFGPFVALLVQVVNVPVMLRYGGVGLYGEWLLISAIPAYLLLTDLGFGNAAGSDMTMRAHAGDRAGAIKTFQSISVLVLALSALLAVLLAAVIFMAPVHRVLHLAVMSPQDAVLANPDGLRALVAPFEDAQVGGTYGR